MQIVIYFTICEFVHAVVPRPYLVEIHCFTFSPRRTKTPPKRLFSRARLFLTARQPLMLGRAEPVEEKNLSSSVKDAYCTRSSLHCTRRKIAKAGASRRGLQTIRFIINFFAKEQSTVKKKNSNSIIREAKGPNKNLINFNKC